MAGQISSTCYLLTLHLSEGVKRPEQKSILFQLRYKKTSTATKPATLAGVHGATPLQAWPRCAGSFEEGSAHIRVKNGVAKMPEDFGFPSAAGKWLLPR